MAIKKCPVCGLPVAGYLRCPTCGADTNMTDEQVYGGSFAADETASSSTTTATTAYEKPKFEPKKKRRVPTLNLGIFRLTLWDLGFILMCNASLISIIVNAIVGGYCWSYWVTFGSFAAFFIAFASAAGTAKKFLSRYRNGIFLINLICSAFRLVLNIKGSPEAEWLTNYFVPCNVMVSCIVFTVLLAFRISPRKIIGAVASLLPQSTIQFVLYLLPNHWEWATFTGGIVSEIFVIVAFGLVIFTLINVTILYFAKLKNKIFEFFN